MSKENPNKNFGTVGVVLATAGSAIGLGNIWKFPYVLGENGGAAFLLVYLLCVLLMGLPVMLSEFYIGKTSHRSLFEAFRTISGNNRWQWMPVLSILIANMLLSFYLVVAGWCLQYMCMGTINGSPLEAVLWTLIAMGLTVGVECAGIKSGIERMSKILMPLLFLLLVVLMIRALTMPNSIAGVRFLFRPDWSSITPSVILSAMGQCFFSLSIGLGCLITYAGYMRKEQDIVRTAFQVVSLDTLVALLAGMAIFPAVFSLGINPTAGPELVFDTLPSVFATLPAGIVWERMFFLLMSIAAITSSVSMMEIIVSFLKGVTGLQRSHRMLLIVPVLLITAPICALSLQPAFSDQFTWFGHSAFDWMDMLSSQYLMPLGGMMITLFMGWCCRWDKIATEIANHSHLGLWFVNVLRILVRYVVPLMILCVFLDGLNLL